MFTITEREEENEITGLDLRPDVIKQVTKI